MLVKSKRKERGGPDPDKAVADHVTSVVYTEEDQGRRTLKYKMHHMPVNIIFTLITEMTLMVNSYLDCNLMPKHTHRVYHPLFLSWQLPL
jgi:hypothetical protein